MKTQKSLISLREVSKTVHLENGEQLHILHPLSLDVESGETLAITGPSGSGKSTLLSLIAGLDLPSAGSLRIKESHFENCDDETRAAFRARHLGIVFQAFHLFDHLTALENVQVSGLIAGLSDEDSQTRAQDCLDAVGLSQRSSHLPGKLSGGEKQRVAIARALLNRPKILLCDEPTGNLDSENAQKIFNLLKSLAEENGCTLILVTHDPHLATQTQRQVKLQAGRIVSDSAGEAAGDTQP